MNRYQKGYLDIRNLFYKKLVSRIYFEDVNLIVFCKKSITNNSLHKKINKPIIFNINITPHRKDIEPNVLDKNIIVNGVKEIAEIVENIYSL